jgi:hypothetical protein
MLFFSVMSDNNIDPVIIWWWLRWCTKRKHWVHLFFCDNLNSGADIVLKEPNQDPELFKSFYRLSIDSSSLLVDLVGPEI